MEKVESQLGLLFRIFTNYVEKTVHLKKNALFTIYCRSQARQIVRIIKELELYEITSLSEEYERLFQKFEEQEYREGIASLLFAHSIAEEYDITHLEQLVLATLFVVTYYNHSVRAVF